MSYAGLRYYQNTMDSERAKFMADMQDRITTFTTPLVFFTLEFNRLDDAHLAGLLAQNADLARYKPVFDRMRAMRPYQLSDELEKFLHDQSVVGRRRVEPAVRRDDGGADVRRSRAKQRS